VKLIPSMTTVVQQGRVVSIPQVGGYTTDTSDAVLVTA
jgi:hypothetical protein